MGEALELARLAIANDRYKMWKIARLLRTLEAEGHSGEAERLYREGNRWWPNHEILMWSRWLGLVTRGNFDGIVRFEKGIPLDVMPLEDRTRPDVLRAIRTGNAAAARKLCAAPTAPYLTCFVGLASWASWTRPLPSPRKSIRGCAAGRGPKRSGCGSTISTPRR